MALRGDPNSKQDSVEEWHEIIKNDFEWRRNHIDRIWSMSEQLVRNSEAGARRGNLVAEFVDTIQSKLMARDLDIRVQPLASEHSQGAKEFEKAADAISSVTGMHEIGQDAVNTSIWSTGWIEIGHPMDPMSFDVERAFIADISDKADQALRDVHEEISEDEVKSYGINVEDIKPFDLNDPAAQKLSSGEMAGDMKPILPVDIGLPWVKSVDPRLIITDRKARGVHETDYIAKINFLTKPEAEILLNTTIDESLSGLGSEMVALFKDVTGKEASDYPEMIALVKVIVRRDRNRPNFSWHHYVYMYEHQEMFWNYEPMNHGRFIPYEPVKLKRHKNFYDKPLAHELSYYADIYDIVFQAIERRTFRELYRKLLIGNGSGLDPKKRKNLLKVKYEGMFDVNDVNAIKEMETSLSNDLFQAAMFFKTAAQAQTGQSDLDRGTAIKGITARQTDALLNATGVNLEAMALEISRTLARVIIKMMFLTTRYAGVGKLGDMVFGREALSFDHSRQDISTSMLYRIKVVDMGTSRDESDRLTWNQFLRTLGPAAQEALGTLIDPNFIARETLKVYDKGPEGLAERTGQGFPAGAETQATGAPQGNSPNNPGQPSPGAVDLLQGQHPERDAGSRGVDTSNLGAGLRQVGMGSGE